MNIKMTSELVEASLLNSFDKIRLQLRLPAKSRNACKIVNFNEFKDDWLDYIEYISGEKASSDNNAIEAVDMYPYKNFNEYIAKNGSNAKIVVLLKLQKSVANDAYKCQDILFKILYEAFGQSNVDNFEDPFRLQTRKYVFAGVIISY